MLALPRAATAFTYPRWLVVAALLSTCAPAFAQVRLVWKEDTRTVPVRHVAQDTPCEDRDGRRILLTGSGHLEFEPTSTFGEEKVTFEYTFRANPRPNGGVAIYFRSLITPAQAVDDVFLVQAWQVGNELREIRLHAIPRLKAQTPFQWVDQITLPPGEGEGGWLRCYLISGKDGCSLAGVGQRTQLALLRAALDAGDGNAAAPLAQALAGQRVGSQEMLQAVHLGNLATIAALAANPENVKATGIGDASPLHVAAQNQLLEVATLLLKHGADPRQRDAGGSTPLQDAAEQGDNEMVTMLLAAGAKADDNQSEFFPLIRMVMESGHLDTLAILMKAGARLPSLRERSRWLQNALDEGKPDMALFLLKNGAKPDAEPGYSSLSSAISRRNEAMIETLLAAGASPDRGDFQHITPVMTAASFGNLALLRRFATAGANFGALDVRGRPALIYAIDGQQSAAVDFLLEAARYEPKQLQLALHRALLDNDAALASKLVEKYGAHLNPKADNGEVAIDQAIRLDALPVLRDALQRGLEPNQRLQKKWTLAAVAERYGRADVVELLRQSAGGSLVSEQPALANERPQVVQAPAAGFTNELMVAKVFGDVEVELMLDPEGNPHFPLVKAQSDPRLVEAAIAMGMSMRFSNSAAWRRLVVPFGFSPENATTIPILGEYDTEVLPVLLTTADELKPLVSARAQPVAVWVELVVNDAGAVASCRTIVSTDRAAEAEATAVVNHWRFRPAFRKGRAVWCRLSRVVVLPSGIGLSKDGWIPAGAVVDGVRQPRLLQSYRAEYPPAMIRQQQRGLVYLKFTIRPDGHVGQAESLAASHPDFVPAAVRALKSWRFDAAAKSGKAEPVDGFISFIFDL